MKLLLASAAMLPRQQQQGQGQGKGKGKGKGAAAAAGQRRRQRRRHSVLLLPLMVLQLLGLLLIPTAAAAFVVAPASRGRRPLQQPPEQTQPQRWRPPFPPSSSLLQRRAFNFFGGGGDKQPKPPKQEDNPFRPELQGTYEDGWGAKIWIYLFSAKIAGVTGTKLPAFPISYDEYVRLSVQLQKGGPQVAKDAVLSVLRSIAFPGFSQIFRTLFPGSSRLACEFNARITPLFFDWLVGPATVEAAEVLNPATGQPEMWRSTVRIQRCRYLEAVQCKGSCASICKIPTQSFFTDDLGMPVTMTPDFATLSCTMTFGQRPPPLADDPVAGEPCFKECPSAKVGARACPRLTALAQSEEEGEARA